MDVFDAIESRVSVRTYEARDVPDELISQILTAGTLASSAGDIQSWEFVVVKDKRMKKELSIAALSQKNVEMAPVVIVVCADLEKSSLRFKERGKELYSLQDTAAAIQNMLLISHALGLGAAWIRAFEEERVKTLLKLPARLRPVGIVTIGFPVPYEKYPKTQIIPFENISWSEEYGKELPWVRKYGIKSRYEFKSVYGYSKDIAEKAAEKAKEKQFGQKIGQRIKDFFKRFRKQ